MARLTYGSRGGDLIAQIDGTSGAFEPSTATYDVYDDATAGTAQTDLLDSGGSPITQVTPDAEGRVRFSGPDAYTGPLWLENSADSGEPRWLVEPTDLAVRVSGISSLALNGVDQGTGDVDLTIGTADITGLQDVLDAQDGQVDVAVTSATDAAQSAADAAQSLATVLQAVASINALGVITQNSDGTWPARSTAGPNVKRVLWDAAYNVSLLPPGDNSTYAFNRDYITRLPS